MSTSELEALRERVASLERVLVESRLKRARRSRKLAAVAALATVFGAAGVWAANGNCPNGLPFCFSPDSPAIASQVNHNFMQLREWVEAKVGPVTQANVTAPATTINGQLTQNGNLALGGNGRLLGGNSAGNFHIDSNNGVYLNWFSGGAGTFFGNGAQGQVGRVDAAGTASFARLSLSANGGNVPFSCITRTATGVYNVGCAAGEIAVGGGGRCAGLWRLTESLPWNGANDADGPTGNGGVARGWRSVCQVWGSAGTYAFPQLGSYAICCRQ